MKLVAAMNTRNELGRYLRRTVPALLEWVDEVRIRDDGSSDGTPEYLESLDRVEVYRRTGNQWAAHEGRLHAELFEWALLGEPTHILAIDADELVVDGPRVRAALEAHSAIAYTLRMVEMWSLDPPLVRCDGGWKPHEVAILYRVPEGLRMMRRRPIEWVIEGRKLASPRVPRAVVTELRQKRAIATNVDVLHLGWADASDRERRHARYAELDGGRYHAKRHLESILWPDGRCDLRSYSGPIPA